MDFLTTVQKQAVLHGDGPLLLLAGAGTGKTAVLTHRIAYMAKVRQIPLSSLLALTFTNKAAQEMTDRVHKLLGFKAALQMGTFHRICGGILRQYGHHLGLTSNFVIYDQDEQLRLVKQVIADLGLDPEKYKKELVQRQLDQWKNIGLGPDASRSAGAGSYDEKIFRRIYSAYQQQCLKANAVDFGDLLRLVLQLLQTSHLVKEQLQQRWRYFLIDEYQDTNPVQIKIIRQLYTPEHSITAVGDDDQAIYRFRGADVGHILDFEQMFPGAAVLRLEQNFRSTGAILAAANQVIAHNHSRRGKTLFTHDDFGRRLKFVHYHTEASEGEGVAQCIVQILRQGISPAQVAILYRMNAQSRPLEEALRRHRVPYRLVGGIRFFDRKEIRDVLAYLRLLVNPASSLDFIRALQFPGRGVGKVSLEKLQSYSNQHQLSLHDSCLRLIDPCLLQCSEQLLGGGGFSVKIQKTLHGFVSQLQHFRDTLQQGVTMVELLKHILHSSGMKLAFEKLPETEGKERLKNIEQLAASMAEYEKNTEKPSLRGYLEETALLANSEIKGAAEDEDSEQVTLLTLHAAKGLEFEWVFLTGMEEGLFPSHKAWDDISALEEERRLCYVGLTRAKRSLHISACQSRCLYGQTKYSPLSRFVKEIPAELLEYEQEQQTASVQYQKYQNNAYTTTNHCVVKNTSKDSESHSVFLPGDKVMHATFKMGTILHCDGHADKQRLTISFASVGVKVIISRFVEKLES